MHNFRRSPRRASGSQSGDIENGQERTGCISAQEVRRNLAGAAGGRLRMESTSFAAQLDHN